MCPIQAGMVPVRGTRINIPFGGGSVGTSGMHTDNLPRRDAGISANVDPTVSPMDPRGIPNNSGGYDCPSQSGWVRRVIS